MFQASARLQKILYLLTSSEGYVNSKTIAESVNLSERTIKKEIYALNELSGETGITIISKRGIGYKAEPCDYSKYSNVKEQLAIRFSGMDFFSVEHTSKANSIARYLIVTDEYKKLDEISEYFHLSKGAIKNELKDARAFLGSFNLSLETKPGYGIKIKGTEFNIRLCMLELFEVYYHKAVSASPNVKYNDEFSADDAEREDIRHCFLKTLRESGIRVKDLYTQRISRYLILMRNRREKGRHIVFSNEDKVVLKKLNEYKVAYDIVQDLSVFPGFNVSEDEIIAIELMLLIWVDLHYADDFKKRYPKFYEESLPLLAQIHQDLISNWGIDISSIEYGDEKLLATLIPLLIKKEFGQLIKHEDLLLYTRNDHINNSPLSMALGKAAADIIKLEKGYDIKFRDIGSLASSFYLIINSIQYDYNPRSLIISSGSGMIGAEIIKEQILRQFGEEKFETVGLFDFYEVRGLDQSLYDYLVADIPFYSYRYSIPFIVTDLILNRNQYLDVLDNIIISGYALDDLFKSFEFAEGSFYRNFKLESRESFLYMLAIKLAVNGDYAAEIEKSLSLCPGIYSRGNTVCIILDARYTLKNRFEIYQCKKGSLWDGCEVKYIIIIAVKFQNEVQAKFVLDLSYQLITNQENVRILLSSNNIYEAIGIVRRSLGSNRNRV